MTIENPNLENENKKIKHRYIYKNNSKNGEVIFDCIADDILEADQKYQEKTGINPSSQAYVGCSIEEIEKNEEESKETI